MTAWLRPIRLAGAPFADGSILARLKSSILPEITVSTSPASTLRI
jgi:hypothetical protein